MSRGIWKVVLRRICGRVCRVRFLTKAYVPLLWGAATGRIAAIAGSTPATSAASELQTMRMARALALYVVGRLARPTTRTGFFWTTPTSSVDGGS